jgi:cobalt-zinc-cadmium efflux system membrane fusion protein
MSRRAFTPLFAALVCVAAYATPLGVQAGEGHDHGDAPAAASGNGPKRQADGSVFLPKATQRQLTVRTMVAAEAALPKAFELSGRVVMDPNAGGKVQAALAGRLEAGPQGLPGVGQRVRKGEVLAHVVPTAGAIERSNQVSQQVELRAARALAEKRVARLQELADTVPRKDIEAAESELLSLTGRLHAVGVGLSNRDALVAPVSGIIASASAVSGQVVDARELIFEVVDPRRLRIEALAYDTAQARGIASAALSLGSQRVPLVFLGGAHSLRDQALPLIFAGQAGELSSLALGQTVKVFVQSHERIQGVQVPLAALLRNPSNQTIVWVKESPERFAPRVVTFEPLDGTSVAVTSGLKAGERVATQGATLINQVR